MGNTYGSMLTGVVSLIADKIGGVMSQLSKIRNNTHPWTKLLTQLALKQLISFNIKGYCLRKLLKVCTASHTATYFTYWSATGCVWLIWG